MSSLGNLYVYRNLTDYALEAFQEAYDYAVKDSCKRYEMTTLQDFGRTYSVRGEYERAIQSYNQAIQIRDSIHETFNSLESELADVYFALGNYEKALDLEKTSNKKQYCSRLLWNRGNFPLSGRIRFGLLLFKESLTYFQCIYTCRSV